jgi:hypothetical protein
VDLPVTLERQQGEELRTFSDSANTWFEFKCQLHYFLAV